MVGDAAAQKITLADYLARRGICKALTSIEARAFGVPYPLVAGWARRHGAVEITPAMIEQLQVNIGHAQLSTAAKAKRGLDAAMGLPVEPVTRAARMKVAAVAREVPSSAPHFPGFTLRSGRGRLVGAVGLPRKV
jgi:hypothetical protein